MKTNLFLHNASPVAPSFPATSAAAQTVPFLRPELGDAEIGEVIDTLKSGWLTSGPKVKRFETAFAAAVKARCAVAVNSCTAALHLAVEALGLQRGQAVLVPSMTFAATAEIVLYQNAIPILVDCDPVTGNLDLADAQRKIRAHKNGELPATAAHRACEIVGIIPVHVGGLMLDMRAVAEFAAEHDLWIVEDAAHAFPAAFRVDEQSAWQMCGENTAQVTCYSFYANKTMTTGEGGMAVTNNELLAEKIRLMSLHGLSHDAWGRFSGKGTWDYKIVAPGYKYNLTDIAAAIGIHQLARAEEMREQREAIARFYLAALAQIEEIELPLEDCNRIHSWHLFPLRLNLETITITRAAFVEELKKHGVGCSVHWRPLHLHPLYANRFGWRAEDLPIATQLWERFVSLPIFPAMRPEEIAHVVGTIKYLCAKHASRRALPLVA